LANYICSVSGDFPENYEIGVRANLWGVVEKYEKRIRNVRPGDLLVFVVGGKFRSIHRVESPPFYDETELWPKKDGSVFPHRIKIGDPLAYGRVAVRILANQIGFMQGKTWGGTIQGASGVFNDKLTDADVSLIEQRLGKREPKQPVRDQRALAESSQRQTALFKFYERDVEDRIFHLLPKMGLKLYVSEEKGTTGRQYSIGTGRIDLLCVDVSSGGFVIVELKKGEAPDQTIM